MPTPDTNGVPPWADFEDLKNKINEIVAKYNNLLVNLDSLNVVSITTNSTTITSDLDGGAFIRLDGNGMVVNNGTFDTFKVDIDGNVTMTSATIQSQSAYPRVVMDPASDLFGAYNTANDYIAIEANYGGAPSLNFFSGGNLLARMDMLLGFEILNVSNTQRMVIDGGNPNPGTDMNGNFYFGGWDRIIDNNSGTTLQQELDAKANYNVNTSLAGAGTYNGGIPINTVLQVAGGGTVTWAGINIGNHTHTQL
jgi:hypothetical protein